MCDILLGMMSWTIALHALPPCRSWPLIYGQPPGRTRALCMLALYLDRLTYLWVEIPPESTWALCIVALHLDRSTYLQVGSYLRVGHSPMTDPSTLHACSPPCPTMVRLHHLHLYARLDLASLSPPQITDPTTCIVNLQVAGLLLLLA